MTETISVSTVPADQVKVADDLLELAGEERLAARREQLTRLGEDLRAGRDLERWAEVDLYAAFLRDETVGPSAKSRRQGPLGMTLDLLPGILIFVPILITWFGLHRATAAYRESRGDPKLAHQSFLEQWQSGFNGRLSGALYFDRIALLTVLAVLVLMAISFWQAMTRRRDERDDERERVELMRRLTVALTDADFELSRFRMNDASRLESGSQQLVEAAKQVGRSVGDARIVQQETAEGLREVRQALERVEQLAAILTQSGDAVRTAADEMGTRLDRLTAAASSVADATGELTRSSTAGSDRLRQAVAGSVQDLSTALGDGQRELGTRIGGALDSSGAGIRQALDDWRTEGAIYSHRHETTAEHLALIVGSIEQLMDRTARALDALPSSVDRFETHSAEAARRLEQSVTGASAKVADDLTQATERIKDELAVLLDALPDARAHAGQTAQEMAALRLSMEQLRGQLAGFVQVLQSTGRRRWFR